MSEIVVNNRGSGGPISIVAAGDQFIIAWTESGIITCARFSTSGERLGGNFVVNDSEQPAAWPVLALVPSGIVVAWMSHENLLLQPLTPDGEKNGATIQVNSAPVDSDSPPSIARLLDASIVVTWGDESQDTVRAQIFRPDLSRAPHSILTVNSPTSLGDELGEGGIPLGRVNYRPVVCLLDDGGFVIAWRRGKVFGSDVSHYRLFNPNGTPSGAEKMAKFDLFLRQHTLAPLPGGGFCGLRFGPGDQSGEDILIIDSYDSSGNFQISSHVTKQDAHTLPSMPMVMQSPDFRSQVVTWVETNSHDDGDSANIRAAMTFADSGSDGPIQAGGAITEVGGPITVNVSPARGRDLPCLTPILADSGFNVAVAWTDSAPSVKARILDHF